MNQQIIFNQILPGDALDILPTLPEQCVDLIFADPPYNLQLKDDLWRPNLTKVDAVDDGWDQFASFAEYDEFTRAWLSGCRRIMKDTATIWVSGTYHNIFRVGAIMQDLGFWILNTVTWWKFNATPNFNGTRLKNDVEFVIWAKKSEASRYMFHHHRMKQFNDFSPDKQLGSVWKIKATGGSERLRLEDGKKLHSTQKPEELLTRIILASSNPGDVVFDPFLGSGTTAAAAKYLRRQWLGIERDTSYVAAAQQRIDAVEPLPSDHPLIAMEPKPVRVAFKQLLDAGYLQTGDRLMLDKPECEAVILDDGRLQVGDLVGSIHRLGARLKGVPSCNGWMHWFYRNADGQLQPLDVLREKYRAVNASG
jgi:DNA modification methylase